MSNLNVALNSSLSVMQTSQYNTAIASTNIANADTDGYTAKLTSNDTQVAGGLAVGVESASLSNAVNKNLLDSMLKNASDAGYSDTIQSYLDQISLSFGSVSDEKTISETLAGFEASLSALAVDPSNYSNQLIMVEDANQIVRELNNSSSDIQAQRSDADSDVESAVSNVNNLLHSIDNLNEDIHINTANNLSTLDLEDKRNTALQDLSELMDFDYFIDSSNQAKIYTTDGTALLTSKVRELSYDAISTVTEGTVFNGINVGGKDITAEISNGEIGGLLFVRDTELPALQDEIDELAIKLIESFNEVTNTGTSVPAPNSVTSSLGVNATDALTGTGEFRIAIVDESGIVQETADFEISTYATVQDFLGDLNNMAGVTANINTEGLLEVSAVNSDMGVAFNEMGGTINPAGEGISNYFGFNDLFIGTDARDITVSETIANSPSLFPSAQLSNDIGLAVQDQGLASGDSSTLDALGDLLVADQSFSAAGNLDAKSTTFAEYSSTIVSILALNTEQATDVASQANSNYESLAASIQNSTGVNLDEEVANMNSYQESYEAGAFVINTLQEMYNTLLKMLN